MESVTLTITNSSITADEELIAQQVHGPVEQELDDMTTTQVNELGNWVIYHDGEVEVSSMGPFAVTTE